MIRAQEIRGPVTEEVEDALAEQWEAMIDEADQVIGELGLGMRWAGPELAVIKRAAARRGLPYETYIKQAAFRQALADLPKAKTHLKHT